MAKRKPDLVAYIRAKLGRVTFEWQPRSFLDTGSSFLNAVLGHKVRGVPYGKIMEISGKPSSGKSTLALELASTAQASGAYVVWIDFENSFDQPVGADDNSWYQSRGLVCHRGNPDSGIAGAENFSLVQPYVGTFKGEKAPRLSTAEELVEEAEGILQAVYAANNNGQIVVVVDSVTAIMPEEVAAAGLTGQNMRTNMALAVLMGQVLKRWIGLLQNYNALAIFINQLRHNPKQMFGDPEYTPGGNALPFYAHVRVRMYRAGGGRLMRKGQQAGIKGVLVNHKNKAGGREREECGFKLWNDGRSQFCAAEEVRKKEP